ncbi:MAG: hypothetical protein SFU86_00815 [Pirellulaceae bacterium]|nr:hypothetical protein [Pirellulaceae bacterium]
MLRTLAMSVILLSAGGTLLAEVPCTAPATSCTAPCNRCQPKPPCLPPCLPPCPPPPAQPQGMFVAPPPMGTVQGPSETTGIQGAELTFPELRLRMPTLSLPSVFRSRSNARMQLDGGQAPFVAGQAGAFAAGVPMAGAMVGGTALAGQAVAGVHGVSGGTAAATTEEQRAAAAELDSKLQEIQDAEERLKRKLEQLQRCLEQLQASQQPAAPPLAATPPPQLQYLPPVAPAAPASYAERPASYIREPAPAHRQWIREPQPTGGRITGFRPAG